MAWAILNTNMIFRHNSRSSLRIFLTFCTQKERCPYTSTLYEWFFTKIFHLGHMGHDGPPTWSAFVTLDPLYRYPLYIHLILDLDFTQWKEAKGTWKLCSFFITVILQGKWVTLGPKKTCHENSESTLTIFF